MQTRSKKNADPTNCGNNISEGAFFGALRKLKRETEISILQKNATITLDSYIPKTYFIVTSAYRINLQNIQSTSCLNKTIKFQSSKVTQCC